MKLELTPQEHKLRALRVQLVEISDGVIVKRGRIEVKITGPSAITIVQTILLKAAGGASRNEICALFAAAQRTSVEQVVRELEARRLLVPVDTDGCETKRDEDHVDVFYWHFDRRANDVAERLNSRSFTILGVNNISRQLALSLTAIGATNVVVVDYTLLCNLRMYDDLGELLASEWTSNLPTPVSYDRWVSVLDPASIGCLIACSDFGGLHLMRNWNMFCVKHSIHFLPVVLQDLVGYVGPLVLPGETACFECLRARQNSHLSDPELERASEELAFEGQAISGFHPSMASILGDIAGVELSKFYGGWMPSQFPGSLVEVSLLTPELTTRKVLKVPRCKTCSTLRTRASESLEKNLLMPGHQVYA